MNTYYIQVPIRLHISVRVLPVLSSITWKSQVWALTKKIAQLSSKCHMILDIIHVCSTNRAGLKLSCLSSRNILSYDVSVCVVCMCVFKQNVRWCNRLCSWWAFYISLCPPFCFISIGVKLEAKCHSVMFQAAYSCNSMCSASLRRVIYIIAIPLSQHRTLP